MCRSATGLLRKAACFLIEPHHDLRPACFWPSLPYAALKGRQVEMLLVGEFIALIASSLMSDRHDASPELPEFFALRGPR